jgi:Leucine-rich repeat (LRR) protein
MTRNAWLLCAVFLLLAIVWVFSYIMNISQRITFTDPNLELALRELIDKTEGQLYTTDVQHVTVFSASGMNITDLKGLECLVNLESLNLCNNNISDISVLASLTKLKTAVLFNNRINDVSPLTSLDNLSRLHLMNNQIEDISPLALLGNLKSLVLSENQITDISPLASHDRLINLYLRDNRIADISHLVSLSDLEVLGLERNPLNAEAVDTWIPQLRERGVDVRW